MIVHGDSALNQNSHLSFNILTSLSYHPPLTKTNLTKNTHEHFSAYELFFSSLHSNCSKLKFGSNPFSRTCYSFLYVSICIKSQTLFFFFFFFFASILSHFRASGFSSCGYYLDLFLALDYLQKKISLAVHLASLSIHLL